MNPVISFCICTYRHFLQISEMHQLIPKTQIFWIFSSIGGMFLLHFVHFAVLNRTRILWSNVLISEYSAISGYAFSFTRHVRSFLLFFVFHFYYKKQKMFFVQKKLFVCFRVWSESSKVCLWWRLQIHENIRQMLWRKIIIQSLQRIPPVENANLRNC